MARTKTANKSEVLQEDEEIHYPDSDEYIYDDEDDAYVDDEDDGEDGNGDSSASPIVNDEDDEADEADEAHVKPAGKRKKKPGVMEKKVKVKAEMVEIKPKGKKARIKAEVDDDVAVESDNDVQIGILNTVTYHVCQKLGFEDGFAKIYARDKAGTCNTDAANDDENHIRFIIPDGQLSNSVIQSIASDEIHAEFLRMRRNLEIVSNGNLKQLEAKSAVKRASSPL
ncbi:hypothetical protein SOVF_000490 [Spinacia oleracea]|nr:hypothetical protein SOVF_000490 [Spinacia oleracea]